MLEFAEFQQNALSLSDTLMQRSVPSLGCCSFFNSFSINNATMKDCYLINLLAQSLQTDNDTRLKEFLDNHSLIEQEKEFVEFKQKALIGIYILIWSKYSSSILTYLNQSMIELFQRDLEVLSVKEMDSKLFDSSLNALSQFCSYAYQHQKIRIFSDLIRNLGQSIQVDIHTLRTTSPIGNSSFYDVYQGVKHTLGLDFLF